MSILNNENGSFPFKSIKLLLAEFFPLGLIFGGEIAWGGIINCCIFFILDAKCIKAAIRYFVLFDGITRTQNLFVLLC